MRVLLELVSVYQYFIIRIYFLNRVSVVILSFYVLMLVILLLLIIMLISSNSCLWAHDAGYGGGLLGWVWAEGVIGWVGFTCLIFKLFILIFNIYKAKKYKYEISSKFYLIPFLLILFVDLVLILILSLYQNNSIDKVCT